MVGLLGDYGCVPLDRKERLVDDLECYSANVDWRCGKIFCSNLCKLSRNFQVGKEDVRILHVTDGRSSISKIVCNKKYNTTKYNSNSTSCYIATVVTVYFPPLITEGGNIYNENYTCSGRHAQHYSLHSDNWHWP